MPSIVPARTASSLPMKQRHTLILRLAYSIYEACGEIPVQLITTVVARVGRDIGTSSL
ncbi:hypothetical protein ABH945_003757 [Paraburkholderia sp. GAS333]